MSNIRQRDVADSGAEMHAHPLRCLQCYLFARHLLQAPVPLTSSYDVLMVSAAIQEFDISLQNS